MESLRHRETQMSLKLECLSVLAGYQWFSVSQVIGTTEAQGDTDVTEVGMPISVIWISVSQWFPGVIGSTGTLRCTDVAGVYTPISVF